MSPSNPERTHARHGASSAMSVIGTIALVLLIVGGLNWALVGLFNFDLVAALFGDMTILSRIVYVLVGIAAVYALTLFPPRLTPGGVSLSLRHAAGRFEAAGFFMRTWRAASLQAARAAFLCSALMGAFFWAPMVTAAAPPPSSVPAPTSVERMIIERSNTFRAAHGLQPTVADATLQSAARDFARFMAERDRYGHEADGRTAVQRVEAAGYAHCLVAENIAWQYNSRGFEPADLARRFAEGWQQSPGHRRNLLDADATEIGIGVARSASSGRHYAVQLFARPAARRMRFELSNDAGRAVNYSFDGRSYRLDARSTATHEHCRSGGDLTLQLPGRAEPVTLKPTDGAHYRIGPGNTLDERPLRRQSVRGAMS